MLIADWSLMSFFSPRSSLRLLPVSFGSGLEASTGSTSERGLLHNSVMTDFVMLQHEVHWRNLLSGEQPHVEHSNFHALQGVVLLIRQSDRPGLIGAVGTQLATGGVNISFMTVARTGRGEEAIMAIGVDGNPSQDVLRKIPSIEGISEFTIFDDKRRA